MTKDTNDAGGGGRSCMWLLLALAAVVVALQIAATGPLKNALWGSHLYAFLPLAIGVIAWAIVIVAGVLLFRGRHRNKNAASAQESGRARSFVLAAVAAVATGVLFWVLRSQQTLLGDAVPLMIDRPGGKSFHPRQPFAMWLQQQLYQLIGPWFDDGARHAQEVAGDCVAVGSVVAGVLFVFVAFGLGRTLGRGRSRSISWLIAVVVMTQGYAVLFFGYIENYTYQILAIAIYVLTALLYLKKRLPLAVAALALVVASGVHLSSISLLPSFVYLLVIGFRNPGGRKDATVAVVASIAGVLALDHLLRSMSPEFTLWTGIGKILHIAGSSQGGGSGLTYMFSAAHARDFLSEHILIGPLAAFLFVPALLIGARNARIRRTPQVVFVSLAAITFLAGSWASSEPLLGYARDWDLFAAAGVTYTIAGLLILVRSVADGGMLRRLLVFATVLSLVQLVPWVWINHSEERSIARFATLPLGHGRAETTIGNHFFRKMDYGQAEQWFLRALEIDPTNPNPNYLLGRLYGLRKRYDYAARHLRRAVLVRPDKVSIRKDYALVLVEMKRCDDALVHLMWLAGKIPHELNYWHGIGETMMQRDCSEQLSQVYAPLLVRLDRQIAANPRNDVKIQHMGVMLSKIDRLEDALLLFRRALEIRPDAPEALFNTGWTLNRMGRVDESKNTFRRFLALYPNHPMATQARAATEQ